jgi:hypothetical protein
MAETIMTYPWELRHGGGDFIARACARERRDDGLWEGWLEFVRDDGVVVRTARETTQPNQVHVQYWATGLTQVYLEGALSRALGPKIKTPAPLDGELGKGGPRPPVVDPYSLYAKGEHILRAELSALATWRLRDIAYAMRLGDLESLQTLSAPTLLELIVSTVRAQHATV